MIHNAAEKNYISRMKKAYAPRNPFTDTSDVPADETDTPAPSAFLRPRYGACIAAAVLTLFVGAGALLAVSRFVRSPIPAASDITSDPYPTEFDSIRSAIECFRSSERAAYGILCEFNALYFSFSDSEDLIKEYREKLAPVRASGAAAQKYICLHNDDPQVYPVSMIYYADSSKPHISLLNMSGKAFTLTGTCRAVSEGAVYEMGTLKGTVAVNRETVMQVDTDFVFTHDTQFFLPTESGETVTFTVTAGNIIHLPSQNRVTELTNILFPNNEE